MSVNMQPPEPFDKRSGLALDLHSIWHTIQGEGIYTGWPAIFIRLAGCNIQCPGCDTEYTARRRIVEVSDILRAVTDLLQQYPNTKIAVITGGEPMRQDITDLVDMLISVGLMVQIESNGILPPPKKVLQWIRGGQVAYCVSPKTSRICEETKYAAFFKYVLKADDISPIDGLPIKALGHKAVPQVARPPKDRDDLLVFVNPMNEHDDDKNFQNLMAARDSALRFGYIVGIQMHLLLNLP
jgi:7-carboxy-7-deazaguanine synthase